MGWKERRGLRRRREQYRARRDDETTEERERVTAVSEKGTRQMLTRYDVDTAATNVVAAEKGS